MIITAPADSIRVTAAAGRRADADLVLRVAEAPVALIGDCLQRMGVVDHAIRPVTGHALMAGTVLPILCREGDNLAIHRALDEARPGDVLVINGRGELHRALFGGILGEACLALEVAGVVVDGSVRDVDDLDRMGLPVYARGVSPAGPYKHGPGTVGDAVACGGIVCHPGDAIIGDRDGLVVIGPDMLPALPELLLAQVALEETMRAKIPMLVR